MIDKHGTLELGYNESLVPAAGIITLAQIRAERPCTEGWRKLTTVVGTDPATTVSIGDIARINDAQDALWCTRCLPETERRNIVRCILPSVKRASVHTTDKRVTDCIAAIDAWLAGDDSINLRAAYAAYAAADAAADAAAYATYYAAADVAYAASAAYAEITAAYAAGAASAASAAAYATDATDDRPQQIGDIVAIYPVTRI